MKCKDCKDTMCKHRSTDAEKDCVLVDAIFLSGQEDYEDVYNCGLRFQNGRLYTVEEHRKPGKGPYTFKKDVTEDIARVIAKYINE